MKRFFALLILGSTAASHAWATPLEKKPGTESATSKMCVAVTHITKEGDPGPHQKAWADALDRYFMADGGCNKGDTLFISYGENDTEIAVARLCDMNRSVVLSGGGAVCSYAGAIKNIPPSFTSVLDLIPASRH